LIAGWSRLEHHRSFTASAREWVQVVMLCAQRIAGTFDAARTPSLLPSLPTELWMMVISQLRQHEMVPSSVDDFSSGSEDCLSDQTDDDDDDYDDNNNVDNDDDDDNDNNDDDDDDDDDNNDDDDDVDEDDDDDDDDNSGDNDCGDDEEEEEEEEEDGNSVST
jgi:hypothetical protein